VVIKPKLNIFLLIILFIKIAKFKKAKNVLGSKYPKQLGANIYKNSIVD
jgi:hypothetical protein